MGAAETWVLGNVAGGVKLVDQILTPGSYPVKVAISNRRIQLLLEKGLIRKATKSELSAFGLSPLQNVSATLPKPSSRLLIKNTEKAKVITVKRK